MTFCSNCGARTENKIPPGDNRPRDVCDACGTIHYQNPRVVVGAIPVWEDKVMLCKRAIEPRYGYWTLPAGFMENAETTPEGAARETLEEAGANIEALELFSMLDVPHVDQVHVFYRARLVSPAHDAGTESLEVRLFDESEIPWKDLAFQTVSKTLRWFFEDRSAGRFSVHQESVRYKPRTTPLE